MAEARSGAQLLRIVGEHLGGRRRTAAEAVGQAGIDRAGGPPRKLLADDRAHQRAVVIGWVQAAAGIAEAHVYGKNTCDTLACLNATMAPVARRVPLIFGEVGDTYDDSSCGHSFMQTFLQWADAHNVGYAAWTWDTWGTCGSLISSYNGTPANDYGAWVKAYFASRA